MYRVASLETPNEPHIWTSFSEDAPDVPGEYPDFEPSWRQFLREANMMIMLGSPVGLYKDGELIASAFQRKDYPKGDMFDRYRIRVTGAMPPAFKAKIISEMKSGVRHMRDF